MSYGCIHSNQLNQRIFGCYPQILSVFMSLIIEQIKHSESGYDTCILCGIEI